MKRLLAIILFLLLAASAIAGGYFADLTAVYSTCPLCMVGADGERIVGANGVPIRYAE